MNPRDLPVHKERDRIVSTLRENQVVVVESPTGSGKTTQLPLILYEAGFAGSGQIGVTQPRRIAAVSVSEFIARQLETEIPGLVGYKMRFEDKTDASTRIKIMTDGILLQELKADPLLSRYDALIIDEAHERSLNIDFILGLLKRILDERKDFKVVVSSATINAEIFSTYFGSCPVVRIDAPMYPVTVIYDPPIVENDYDVLVDKITDICRRIVVDEKRPGDILIFLSGERLIKDTIASLESSSFSKQLMIMPLYGRLSKEEQESVFVDAPKNKTKVVVSTNIAETSVTIEGITSVIDSGLAKLNHYNPRTYTSSLVEGPISVASANQRKGRAGRTQPGYCYRLYAKEDFESRNLFTLEEIYRTDLSEVVLRMADLGITEFEDFHFLSPPGKQGVHAAVETLRLLEALNDENLPSRIGEMMMAFPLLPRHSRMIVEAILEYPSVIYETIVAAAFLSTNTPYLLPQGEELEARRAHHAFRDDAGDFVSYLKILDDYRRKTKRRAFCERYYLDERTMGELDNIVEQLSEIVGEMEVPVGSGGPVADYLCAVSRGLIQFVCVRSGRNAYQSLTAERIQIHPGSVMYQETPMFIVAGEIVRTSRMYARSVSPLQKAWLTRISPDLAKALLKSAGPAGGQKRDTTWQVKIGGHSFEMRSAKGNKKIAVLPWKELKAVVEDGAVAQAHLRNVKGMVSYDGASLLAGEKLPNILKIARLYRLPEDFAQAYPRKQSFTAPEQSRDLASKLANVMMIAPIKKSSKTLGFVALKTDNIGLFWFKAGRNFHSAANESLASLEALIDMVTEADLDEATAESINAAYRRVAGLVEA